MRYCKNCSKIINYSSVRKLCDDCLVSLSFVCSYCGTTVYNIEMKSKRRFLNKKVCSKSCQYSICQKKYDKQKSNEKYQNSKKSWANTEKKT